MSSRILMLVGPELRRPGGLVPEAAPRRADSRSSSPAWARRNTGASTAIPARSTAHRRLPGSGAGRHHRAGGLGARQDSAATRMRCSASRSRCGRQDGRHQSATVPGADLRGHRARTPSDQYRGIRDDVVNAGAEWVRRTVRHRRQPGLRAGPQGSAGVRPCDARGPGEAAVKIALVLVLLLALAVAALVAAITQPVLRVGTALARSSLRPGAPLTPWCTGSWPSGRATMPKGQSRALDFIPRELGEVPAQSSATRRQARLPN